MSVFFGGPLCEFFIHSAEGWAIMSEMLFPVSEEAYGEFAAYFYLTQLLRASSSCTNGLKNGLQAPSQGRVS